MADVIMMMFEGCPYCRQARNWMKELVEENPEYAGVRIEMHDEKKEPAFADSLDYYYVPTYYVNGVKVHEGAATKEKIRAVYEKALGR